MNESNNELIKNFIEEFQDEETRHIYTEEFLNSKIATQIKTLREQRGWTQAKLAEKVEMKQERISVLEDVNYSAWTLNVLRRLAKAFDLRIDLSFADFGSFLGEFSNFNRTTLERKSFKDDEAFKSKESKASNQKPKNAVVKQKRQPFLGYVNTSNTNYPFSIVRPKQTGIVTNTTPELPFTNSELAWSQSTDSNVEKKSSSTAVEEDRGISTTQTKYYVAVRKR